MKNIGGITVSGRKKGKSSTELKEKKERKKTDG